MNQFLADHYGTGGDQGLTEDEAALEKMAQLTLLVKEAEEEGIDLSELTEDEALELAEELYGEDYGEDSDEEYEEAGSDEEDFEKEAAAKVEEADFLGRVMAHSLWQELDSIQKHAAKAGPGSMPTGAAATAAEKKIRKEMEARKAQGEARKAQAASSAQAAKYEGKSQAGTAGKRRLFGLLPGKPASGASQPGRVGAKLFEMKQKARGLPQQTRADWRAGGGRRAKAIGRVGGAALGTAALGYGAYRAGKAIAGAGKEKKSSAFEKVAEQRALEMLYEGGYIDEYGNVFAPEIEQEKTASDYDFDTMVEVAALQMLEENGWPVQWNE